MDEHPKIRAVIFDMGGVLVDSESLINAAAVTMFKENGLIVQPEDFLPFVGAGEDRYIGGVAAKYDFPLDLTGSKMGLMRSIWILFPRDSKPSPEFMLY